MICYKLMLVSLAIVTFQTTLSPRSFDSRQRSVGTLHAANIKNTDNNSSSIHFFLEEDIADAVDMVAGSSPSFENRFSFRPKPGRIRFRILDPALSVMGLTDLQIPESDFYDLSITPRTVFITENEINGLAFPSVPDALVIFGLGYSLSALAGARWMNPADL